MSIQMLLKVNQRSIFNDLESLFYVVLDALSARLGDRRPEDAPGFVLHSELSTALMRVGILIDKDQYLDDFGVDKGQAYVPKTMLDALYQFLFFANGCYIGPQLRGNYERSIDSAAAAEFMDAETLSLLRDLYEQPGQEMQSVSTPTRGLSDTATPTEAAASKPLPPPQFPLEIARLSVAPSSEIVDADDPFGPEPSLPPVLPAAKPAVRNVKPLRSVRITPPAPAPRDRVLRPRKAERAASAASSGSGTNTRGSSVEAESSKRRRVAKVDGATGQSSANKENKKRRK
ncbi:hypothetical protein GGI20_005236 [Coemansia sp. BCRC 34301]|nr:hypothetical protein GGI20_005236 [Coemansia sp. BCRC 34301]